MNTIGVMAPHPKLIVRRRTGSYCCRATSAPATLGLREGPRQAASPYPRANGDHTIDVLQRLRAEVPERKLIVLWDGAPYHRAKAVRGVATTLGIDIMPLPGYSPDLMPVEALWRWLREDVTDHHCHATTEDLTRRAADFEARLNHDPFVIADRLWVKDSLDPEEEKLRFSN
jgi:transposase